MAIQRIKLIGNHFEVVEGQVNERHLRFKDYVNLVSLVELLVSVSDVDTVCLDDPTAFVESPDYGQWLFDGLPVIASKLDESVLVSAGVSIKRHYVVLNLIVDDQLVHEVDHLQ